VLSVKLNKKRMIVALETKIYIYDMASLKLLYTLDTPHKKGIIAFSSNDKSLLAYPSSEAGDVALFDGVNLSALGMFPAHKGGISALVFNDDSTLLATASDKGTVIRVFSLPHLTKMFTLRRGSYPAIIYSICFAPDSSQLCVSSNHDTIHIFKLENTPTAQTNNNITSVTIPSITTMTSYLSPLTESLWEAGIRNFAFIKLAAPETACICSFCPLDPKQIYVISELGWFSVYQIEPHGGECKKNKRILVI